MKRIAVFCGANIGTHPIYKKEIEELGKQLVRNKYELVYGGAKVGLMGAIADAVLKEGGKVIGVMPDFMDDKELAHEGLTELIWVASMHERKTLMADLSDGFIATSGGFGTFDELFEILTWAQLGLHQKPIGLLNINGLFNPLLQMLDNMVENGFLKEHNKNKLLVADNPSELLQKMKNFQGDYQPKWINKNQV
ncbi:MAG: TIGR00730 family Rossman fold protein [Thermoflexibacter sp.]